MAVLIMALSSCQSGEKQTDSGEKYFSKLGFYETSFDRSTGLHAITAEQAREINHYRFSYDDQGRLVGLQYCRGDELLDGSSTGVPRIEITYEGNKEIHHYFNTQGEPRSYSRVFSAEYELDDEGVRKHLRFFDKEGNPVENNNGIAWYDWEVLASGQLRENRYNMDGEETVMNEFCPF